MCLYIKGKNAAVKIFLDLAAKNTFKSTKLKRLFLDCEILSGLKMACNLTLNINGMEGFQMWHFTMGKDVLLCCHENEWERHLVTKRWPFPFAV